ncbi:MAG: F0F1 ATP synthase subunit alpha [Candidatus Margulisbacteria bacterium GWF2_35_9]|nr:MAG: F0F1 ATP synthase subunit alpha [Candidatus Margulisbacteria bacterium GWF2_35_9]
MVNEKAEEKINLVDKILEQIKVYREEINAQEVGIVLDSGDGIARIGGLPGALVGEMLDFGEGVSGVVFNLEMEEVVAIILNRHVMVKEGHAVKKTGRIIEVPVGEQLLGRVIGPLGKPMDGLDDLVCDEYYPIENSPPGVIDRKPVDKPLQTGYMMIDATVPIGHGQRELIIGDRQTGKTTLAIDAIINQKGKDVVCVYVAIGQKNSTVAQIKKTLKEHEALQYTVIVNAPASSPSSKQFYAPYAGCAIAEYFMNQGRQVLIVYDDLTKHAHAYRNISLLLKRPPGREAYPGDIFYIHSRLLERAAQLNDKLGGGSITALPIVETQNGDIAAYIPTNVISITDGQIFLTTELFRANIRPAINPGISVSRVGGAAQIKGMKKVAGLLRLTLAQFREKEKFSLFAADLDERTTHQLRRGKVLIEILKQKQHRPMKVIDQMLVIYAAVNGFFDDVPLEKIESMRADYTEFMKRQASALYEIFVQEEMISDEHKTELNHIIKQVIKDLS